MREKWELYLEKYLTKADSYYIRDLLTLAGPLKAPPERERASSIPRSCLISARLPQTLPVQGHPCPVCL